VFKAPDYRISPFELESVLMRSRMCNPHRLGGQRPGAGLPDHALLPFSCADL
jgi:hypothetical protein